jgi:hypothetical protein
MNRGGVSLTFTIFKSVCWSYGYSGMGIIRPLEVAVTACVSASGQLICFNFSFKHQVVLNNFSITGAFENREFFQVQVLVCLATGP